MLSTSGSGLIGMRGESMEQAEKRMAGDYEIIHAMHIGDREIVIGVNPNASTGEKYMCGIGERNELFAQYSQVMISDGFADIVKLYGDRVSQQAAKTLSVLDGLGISDEERQLVSKDDYLPVYYEDDLHNKIVVIRPEVLRPEYHQAPYQIRLCTGGFGASPKSRGSACFCKNLITGESSRFERLDIAGIMPADKLPDWAKKGLQDIKQKQAAQRESR